MRKIFTLLILLLLLPVTALAAGDAPAVLYVGNYQITNTSGTTYLKAGSTRGSLEEGSETDWTVKYAPTTATLTLKGANITGNYHQYYNPHTAGIYALCSSNQSVALTIELIGENTITGNHGIFVNAEIGTSIFGADATLTITGENNGSLGVSGSDHGIYVKSGTGKASLTINDASVVAKTTQTYSGCAGVYVMSSTEANVSPNLSLAVNGGSLTASGTGSSDGIQFYVGSSQASDDTTSLTVSKNAIVDARNGGISAKQISNPINTDISATGSSGGIVFDDKNGTVYGKVELQEDLEIGEGESLTIGKDASLTVPSGTTLTNNGTVTTTDGGSLTNQGTINNSGTLPDSIEGSQPPKITTTSLLPGGTVGTAYNQTLLASGDATITWSSSDLPNWLTLNSDGTISGTPTAAGASTFTVTATNDSGSDSEEYTLTIKAVSVTDVSLDKDTLSLYIGGSETLTAIITPDNASNKSLTWSSDNQNVATVENGKVTAKAAGTATITVTTEDGSKTATCQVTVLHSNLKYFERKEASCTEPGNIEYWYCEGCNKYFSDEAGTTEIKLEDVVIPATGHHYVNGYCTKCGHRDPDYRPDPISYYNIYVEDVCDGVEVSTSKQVVREGGSINVYVEKDTARYTFDNFKVYYKRSYYGTWDELKEGTQPGEYPIKNIWTHIYIKAEGAEEKEDPTGIESIEGVKVYTKDGSLYVQTPQREQVIIVSMSGAVVKNEEQIGLKQYHGLQPGIYIVRVGDRAYKVRLN